MQTGNEVQMLDAMHTSKERLGPTAVKCKAYVGAEDAQDMKFAVDQDKFYRPYVADGSEESQSDG